MEECDVGPAPRVRVSSGAAGVHLPQAGDPLGAEVGAGRRSQPHAGPQIAAQQQAAQQRHALLQEAVATRGQRRLVGRVQLGGRAAQAAGCQVAGLRVLAARAVGHGQPGGHRQHQPVAAHTGYPLGGVPAARLVPLPTQRVPDGFQAPEALFDPVAAGIQGGLRLCHRGVGQQHPGLRLTVGVQHNQSAVQRLVAESLPGAHPQAARSRDQRTYRHALGLALRPKGDVGSSQSISALPLRRAARYRA